MFRYIITVPAGSPNMFTEDKSQRGHRNKS